MVSAHAQSFTFFGLYCTYFLGPLYFYDLQVGERALDSQAVNYGVFGNVLVIGGFAAFAFVVRYVLQTMAAAE